METMNLYDNLLEAVHYEYDTIRFFKKSEQREVSLVRHKSSGTLSVFKHISGNREVYRKLLAIYCPNLPQIMEVGEKEGRTALLEEYVQGDNLYTIHRNQGLDPEQGITGITYYRYPAMRTISGGINVSF